MWKTGKKAFIGVIGLSTATLMSVPVQAGEYGWHRGRHVTIVKKVYVHDDWRWRHRSPRVIYVEPPPPRVVHYDSYPTTTYSDRSMLGGLIGAAVGALAGNTIGRGGGRIAATIGGGIIGAIVGGSIGRSMDRVDALETQNALETARVGQTVSWQNPDNGTRYSVTPTRTYQEESGRYCRDFETWGWIDGYEEKLHGTACREADGTWRKVS